jgi:hypothetical protein
LFLCPALNDFFQGKCGQVGTPLQEAIEAQQQLFVGVVPIAEGAHLRHMLFHNLSEEAAEGREPTQLLQRPITIFTDEGSHDRRGAGTILTMQLCKGVGYDYFLVVQPIEIALHEESPVVEDVRRPLEAVHLQPLLQD